MHFTLISKWSRNVIFVLNYKTQSVCFHFNAFLGHCLKHNSMRMMVWKDFKNTFKELSKILNIYFPNTIFKQQFQSMCPLNARFLTVHLKTHYFFECVYGFSMYKYVNRLGVTLNERHRWCRWWTVLSINSPNYIHLIAWFRASEYNR